MDNKSKIKILPKGSIFLALGGYTGEANGLPVKENTEAVMNVLEKSLKGNNSALIHDGKQLIFIPIELNHKPKRWYEIF